MKRYLFAGPTLPDAASIVGPEVQVLPPIQSGDILRLGLSEGDAVGIVDGYFHQRPAVRHKEILSVLADGVSVLGAASIGALRAAELDRYGMQGVGEIYRAYRDGELEADDEVALVHGSPDDGYRSFSEPMVNIRATLNAAVVNGLLDAAARADILGVLAVTPYAGRSYDRVAELADERCLDGQRLRAFCAAQGVDLKRSDAVELVHRLRTVPSVRRQQVVELNRTIYLDGWQLMAAATDTGDGHGLVGDLDVLRACQLFAVDFPAFYRTWVLDQLRDQCAQNCREYDPGAAPVDTAIAHGQHRGLYTDVILAGRRWVGDELSGTDRAAAFLARSYAVAPGVRDLAGLRDAILRSPAATSARRLVRAVEHVNEQAELIDPDFDVQRLAAPRILEWFTTHWASATVRGGSGRCTPEPDMTALESAALDRAIDSVAALEAIARPYYLAARYNPELVTFRITDIPTGCVLS